MFNPPLSLRCALTLDFAVLFQQVEYLEQQRRQTTNLTEAALLDGRLHLTSELQQQAFYGADSSALPEFDRPTPPHNLPR